MRLFRSKTQSPERRTVSPSDKEIEARHIRQRRLDVLFTSGVLVGTLAIGSYLGVTCYQENALSRSSQELSPSLMDLQGSVSESEQELSSSGRFCSNSRVSKQTLKKGEYLTLSLMLLKVVEITNTHVLIQGIGEATPIRLALDKSKNVVTSFCCTAEKTGKDAVIFSLYPILSIDP
jgi:hypothetical protein